MRISVFEGNEELARAVVQAFHKEFGAELSESLNGGRDPLGWEICSPDLRFNGLTEEQGQFVCKELLGLGVDVRDISKWMVMKVDDFEVPVWVGYPRDKEGRLDTACAVVPYGTVIDEVEVVSAFSVGQDEVDALKELKDVLSQAIQEGQEVESQYAFVYLRE